MFTQAVLSPTGLSDRLSVASTELFHSTSLRKVQISHFSSRLESKRWQCRELNIAQQWWRGSRPMPGRNALCCAHLDLYKRNHWSRFSRTQTCYIIHLLLLLSFSPLLFLSFWHHHYLPPIRSQIFILTRSPQAYNIGAVYPYLHLYLDFLLH